MPYIEVTPNSLIGRGTLGVISVSIIVLLIVFRKPINTFLFKKINNLNKKEQLQKNTNIEIDNPKQH